MTGRLALIFCLGLAVSATAADGEPALRFRKDVDRGAATGEEILAVPLDSDIYAATRDGYPDLRISGRSRRAGPVLARAGRPETDHPGP